MATAVYGLGYIRTSQGLLKILEMVICFIGFILVVTETWTNDLLNALVVGTIIGFVVSLLMFLLHVTKLGSSIEGILAFQLYFHALWFFYLLIVSAVLLSKYYNDQLMAGGGFGLIASFLYLGDAIDCFRINRDPVFCLN